MPHTRRNPHAQLSADQLAHAFHTWYHGTQVLVADESERNAKLTLACAARQVLANGLNILGVSAPEKM